MFYLLPVDLVTPVVTITSESKEDNNLIDNNKQKHSINMFEPVSTSPSTLLDNETTENSHSVLLYYIFIKIEKRQCIIRYISNTSILIILIYIQIPTITPTCFNSEVKIDTDNYINNLERENIKIESENNNVSNNHFETTIHFKDDDDYDDWDEDDVDKSEEKVFYFILFILQKSDDMEDSKIEVEHYGSNIIYDNKTYKAGVKEDDVYIIYL